MQRKHLPTQEEILAVKDLLDIAKEQPVGSRLAALLTPIAPYAISEIFVITDAQELVNPFVDRQTVMLYDKQSGAHVDIDHLDSQFRWDAICAIWNELVANQDPDDFYWNL